MKRIAILTLILTSIAGPAMAWSVEKNYGSWIQIRCGSGTLVGIKQKSNGKWANTAYLGENFGSKEAAASAACRGRGG